MAVVMGKVWWSVGPYKSLEGSVKIYGAEDKLTDYVLPI